MDLFKPSLYVTIRLETLLACVNFVIFRAIEKRFRLKYKKSLVYAALCLLSPAPFCKYVFITIFIFDGFYNNVNKLIL